MTTILYAHPYDKSFNHAVLEQVKAKLEATGREYKVLDLYADGFNPSMEAASLRLYGRGDTADPLAAGYLDTLLATDEFIMIFPIWWANIPAIVGGFFDKVMLSGKAYRADERGELVPAQIHIKHTVVLTPRKAPPKGSSRSLRIISHRSCSTRSAWKTWSGTTARRPHTAPLRTGKIS